MSIGLQIQDLPSGEDRVIAIASLVGDADRGWFSSRRISEIFEGFRVPEPKNLSATLNNLRLKGLVRRRKSDPAWASTPAGLKRAQELVGSLATAAELARIELWGSEFGNAVHSTIPPILSPAAWSRQVTDFLEAFEFDRNVFCMTRFPESSADLSYLDPVAEAIDELRAAATAHGLTLHLASDRQIADDLLGNVAAHMWACRFGIALLEDKAGRGLNYNVIFEVGAMMMTGRRCALLRDPTAPHLPTDIAGQIYKPVDLGDAGGVRSMGHGWFSADLGLGDCGECAPTRA